MEIEMFELGILDVIKMYLSKLVLNPRNNKVRKDVANCQQFHRTIMSAFPSIEEKEARQKMEILFRLESNYKNNGQYTALVQSHVVPDWSKLPDRYLLEKGQTKHLDDEFLGISEGDIFAFRIRVNPTKKVGTALISDIKAGNPKKNGRREPLRNYDERIDWLLRKAENSGFELLTTQLSDSFDLFENDEGYISVGDKIKDGVYCKMTFSSVVFEGRLKVVNRVLFLEALKNGIGSGKAYGFGLLSIAKIR